MPHGYGFFTFGWKQAGREIEREEKFNERYMRLCKIQHLANQRFLTPCEDNHDLMKESELIRLSGYVAEMSEWQIAIDESRENARQYHLTKYSTAIRKAVVTALKLCEKYKIGETISIVEYDSREKMIRLNGKDLYFIG